MSKIGGTTIDTWYWTSTQYNSYFVYKFGWDYGDVNTYNKNTDYGNKLRPVCSL